MTPDTNPKLKESWIKLSWIKLSELAKRHRVESAKFNRLCEAYYGIEWYNIPSIVDNDHIIDTIDYGTDALTFEEFDELVRSAMNAEKQAVSA